MDLWDISKWKNPPKSWFMKTSMQIYHGIFVDLWDTQLYLTFGSGNRANLGPSTANFGDDEDSPMDFGRTDFQSPRWSGMIPNQSANQTVTENTLPRGQDMIG